MNREQDRGGAEPEDREVFVRARFQRTLRDQLARLATPAVIAEHADHPVGSHSPSLAVVLASLRQAPTAGKLALLFSPRDESWQILTLSGEPGVPHLVDQAAPFTDESAALHAVFLRRLADLGLDVDPDRGRA